MKLRTIAQSLGCFFLAYSIGCGGNDGGNQPLSPRHLSPREAAVANGYTRIAMEHGNGFLTERPESPPPVRKLLYLEGTHREIGYQVGYLCPEEVRAMVLDYTNDFLFQMLKLPFSHEDLGPLWDLFRAWLIETVSVTEPFVPNTLREEMQGMADGFRDARAEGRVQGKGNLEYGDILFLNQGMDVLFALLYGTLGQAGVACNQYACWGPHTADGRFYHGRDFQYPTVGVYQNVALVSVYRPLKEDGSPAGLPFITVTAPGFVGQATGMNSLGISLGVNEEDGWPVDRKVFGRSCLIVLRSVLEAAGSLEEAVQLFREAPRGCPWHYLIGDAGAKNATVLETISSFPPEDWMRKQLAWGEALGSEILEEPFTSAFPAQGVMERPADYVLPSRYRGKGIQIPWYHNDPKYKDDHTFLNFYFPDPHEDSPYLVAAANHFLLPEMRPFEWSPLLSVVLRDGWPDTEWRYGTHVKLILERSTGGRSLDWEEAWRTIDFLNPNTPEGSFFWGPDPNQEVHGHVVLMDGQDLVIRARYGYYNQEPVEVRFRDFLD